MGVPRVLSMAICLLLTFPGGATAAGGVVWYVDADAPGADDGSGWADAFRDLQDAMKVAGEGDEVRVAAGTYKPTKVPGDHFATFALPSEVRLLGGFAGFGADDPDERDVDRFETTLSGDILDDDARTENGRIVNMTDNCFHVVSAIETGDGTLVDGFTIRGGSGNGCEGWHANGGGMFIEDSQFMVSHCRFEWNSGGIHHHDCSPLPGDQGGGGGGMLSLRSDTTVTDCTFHQNAALGSYGGIYNREGAISITRCVFTENLSQEHQFGAGVGSEEGTAMITDCLFFKNLGGGAASFRGEIEIARCLFERNLDGGATGVDGRTTVRDCTFSKNSEGGVLGASGTLSVERCSFVFNTNLGSVGSSALGAGDLTAIISESVFLGNQTLGATVRAEDSSLTFIGCRFEGNVGRRESGGIRLRRGSVDLIGCSFDGNLTDDAGGALNVSMGTVSIRNVVFSENSAGLRGGAVHLLDTDARLSNTLFAKNESGCGPGGGMHVDSRLLAVDMTNCAFAENSSSCEGAAGLHVSWAEVDIANSIFFGNRRDGIGGEAAQLMIEGAPIRINHSCVEGWTGDLGGVGNIGDDPLFVKPNELDYRLQSGSPAVDAADNLALGYEFRLDLDGNLRFVDDPEVEDTGVGACPVIDMGAYEFQAIGGCCERSPRWACDGDVDGDAQVNPVDSGLVQAAFGSTDEADLCQYDVDCDGQINPTDSALVEALFGTCEAPRDACE